MRGVSWSSRTGEGRACPSAKGESVRRKCHQNFATCTGCERFPLNHMLKKMIFLLIYGFLPSSLQQTRKKTYEYTKVLLLLTFTSPPMPISIAQYSFIAFPVHFFHTGEKAFPKSFQELTAYLFLSCCTRVSLASGRPSVTFLRTICGNPSHACNFFGSVRVRPVAPKGGDLGGLNATGREGWRLRACSYGEGIFPLGKKEGNWRKCYVTSLCVL